MIKRLLLVKVFFLASITLLAPSRETLPVTVPEKINPYTKLLYAIAMVETKGDTLAFNPAEEARGVFQIRPIRLEDFNKRTGSNIRKEDLFRYDVSEKIFMYYATLAGHRDFERIARGWNGSGPKTKFYWNRVKKYL